MNESIETRLGKYRCVSPPEELRARVLANLKPRRSRHIQQKILQFAIATFLAVIAGGAIVQHQTAGRMVAVMCPDAARHELALKQQFGKAAWCAKVDPVLPLSPRRPDSGNVLAFVLTNFNQGDAPCTH